jgi:hypothetical protein
MHKKGKYICTKGKLSYAHRTCLMREVLWKIAFLLLITHVVCVANPSHGQNQACDMYQPTKHLEPLSEISMA